MTPSGETKQCLQKEENKKGVELGVNKCQTRKSMKTINNQTEEHTYNQPARDGAQKLNS